MNNYYNKNKSLVKNLINCLNSNKMFYSFFFGMAFYISYVTKDFYRGFFTIYFVTVFSYFSHSIGHKYFPFNIFHKIHHDDKVNDKWWARGIEWLVNFLQIGGILLIPINELINKKYGVRLLNNYVILYFSFVYTSHHMINYHLMKVDTHVRHHKDVDTNFGPDYMDTLMGTKQHNSKFEDMKESILNTLISTLIVIFIYTKKLF